MVVMGGKGTSCMEMERWMVDGSDGTHLQLFGAYQDGKGTGSRMEMERWMVDGSDGRSAASGSVGNKSLIYSPHSQYPHLCLLIRNMNVGIYSLHPLLIYVFL